MRVQKLFVVPALLGLLLGSAPAASAAVSSHQLRTVTTSTAGPSALVKLRVEGATGTIFEGTVRTRGHNVTTVAGGTHHCDGTNNGVNPTAGPTATGALDTGSATAGFTFDGPYDTSFDDFFITRVGGETQTATQFWGILLNGAFTAVGGCQQRVATGDEVLFAFDAFSKSHALALTGPARVRVGRPATYHVTDEQTGTPIAGASVNGATSNAAGDATVTFTAPAVTRVKADRSDSIRSNAVITTVRP
jgi:hypothetical protein